MTILTNEGKKRFEVEVEGRWSVLDYEVSSGVIIFTHTGVPRELEGRGIASALAKAGLEYARANQLQVVPACSFIEVYMRRHPEYKDLLAKS